MRKGRDDPTLRYTFTGRPEQAFIDMARCNESPKQRQETCIPNPLPHTAHQHLVMHGGNVAGQITFDHPATRRVGTVLKLKLHGTDGVMHTTLRSTHRHNSVGSCSSTFHYSA